MRGSPLLLLLLSLAACGGRAPTEARLFEVAPEEANLVLHVERPGGGPGDVDLRVWIDDARALETRLSGEAGARETYHFRLPPGVHVIRAVSDGGPAELEQAFRLGDAPRHWASLTLWDLPGGGARLAFVLSRLPAGE